MAGNSVVGNLSTTTDRFEVLGIEAQTTGKDGKELRQHSASNPHTDATPNRRLQSEPLPDSGWQRFEREKIYAESE